MGDFLSTPNKTKDSSDGENTYLKFGASAMQGWRYRMEDTHITSLNNLNNKFDIFGVFDGHGGKEVSQFVKKHFVEEFLKNTNTKRDNIKQSLIETFLQMDKLEGINDSELKIGSKVLFLVSKIEEKTSILEIDNFYPVGVDIHI